MKNIIKKVTFIVLSFFFSCSIFAMEVQQVQCPPSVVLPSYNVTAQTYPITANYSIDTYCSNDTITNIETSTNSLSNNEYVHYLMEKKQLDEKAAHLKLLEKRFIPEITNLHKNYQLQIPPSVTISFNEINNLLLKQDLYLEAEQENLSEMIGLDEDEIFDDYEEFVEKLEEIRKKIKDFFSLESKKYRDQKSMQHASFTKYLSRDYWIPPQIHSHNLITKINDTMNTIVKFPLLHISISQNHNVAFLARTTREDEIISSIGSTIDRYLLQYTNNKQTEIDIKTAKKILHDFFSIKLVITENLKNHCTNYHRHGRYFMNWGKNKGLNSEGIKMLGDIAIKISQFYKKPKHVDFAIDKEAKTIYITNIYEKTKPPLPLLSKHDLSPHDFSICQHLFDQNQEPNNQETICCKVEKYNKTTCCTFGEDDIIKECGSFDQSTGSTTCSSKDCWINENNEVACKKSCSRDQQKKIDPTEKETAQYETIKKEVQENCKNRENAITISPKNSPEITRFFKDQLQKFTFNIEDFDIEIRCNDTSLYASINNLTKIITITPLFFQQGFQLLKFVIGHELEHEEQRDSFFHKHAEHEAHIIGVISALDEISDEVDFDPDNFLETNNYPTLDENFLKEHNQDFGTGHTSPKTEIFVIKIAAAKFATLRDHFRNQRNN